MRLWHYRLIDVLPRQQLLGQWRELNSIFKLQNKHILINYVYEYDKSVLYQYTMRVIGEMLGRYYKIKDDTNFHNYFSDMQPYCARPNFLEHDDEYLTICYYNLKEKYIRGGISKEEWLPIEKRYKEIMGND